ncbi:MAG: metal ABC transporter permease [Gemmatimonadetes bacterium]|nr:MAG: metal ABC transporter permease [Gemmatimonadota bacterium]
MFSEWVSILLPGFIVSLFVVSTLTYFGLHVLGRGIIFVDLALAQVSALGAIIAILLWGEDAGTPAFWLSLAFTFMAAIFLAFLRHVQDKTTREVAIGCLYIVSMALGIVLLSTSPHGSEHLKALLNGNLLWVTSPEIIQLGVVSVITLVLFYRFHAQFYQLSFETGTGESPSFGWEALFFILFALIIAMIVQIVGVLMVFAYLILPAFAASMLATSFRTQYLLGSGISILMTVAGGFLSVKYDLPTGALIVCLLGILPVVAALIAWRR